MLTKFVEKAKRRIRKETLGLGLATAFTAAAGLTKAFAGPEGAVLYLSLMGGTLFALWLIATGGDDNEHDRS